MSSDRLVELRNVLRRLEHLYISAWSEDDLRRRLGVLLRNGRGGWVRYGSVRVDRGRHTVLLMRWEVS